MQQIRVTFDQNDSVRGGIATIEAIIMGIEYQRGDFTNSTKTCNVIGLYSLHINNKDTSRVCDEQ